MAKRSFLGVAQSKSQIDTITIAGTWADTETITVTVGAKTAEFVCGASETTTTVAAGIAAACRASTAAEFLEITWSDATNVVTATSAAGLPVSISVAETASSGTATLANVQAATGPNHWSNAANWSGGVVPATSDEVFIESNVSVLYGLPTSLELAKFVQTAGRIGLPDTSETGGYSEYRVTYAGITCLDVQISKSIRGCRLDLLSGASVVTVGTTTRNPVDLKLGSASSSVNIISGRVNIGALESDVSTVGTVRCGDNGTVNIGAGVTVTTVLSAGTSNVHGTVTTLTVESGSTSILGSAAITTANINGGSLVHKSTGTITTCNIGPGALNCNDDIRAKTITNLNLRRGGTIMDRYRILTYTNGIQPSSDADMIVSN